MALSQLFSVNELSRLFLSEGESAGRSRVAKLILALCVCAYVCVHVCLCACHRLRIQQSTSGQVGPRHSRRQADTTLISDGNKHTHARTHTHTQYVCRRRQYKCMRTHTHTHTHIHTHAHTRTHKQTVHEHTHAHTHTHTNKQGIYSEKTQANTQGTVTTKRSITCMNNPNPVHVLALSSPDDCNQQCEGSL